MSLDVYQYELNGVVFGHGTDLPVGNIEGLGASEKRARMYDLPGVDGRAFGREWRGGKTVTIEGGVKRPGDAAAAWDRLEDLADAFDGGRNRLRPGTVDELKLRRPGAPEKVLYGRPDRFDPDPALSVVGWIPWTATFECADGIFYSLDHVSDLSLVPASTGGLITETIEDTRTNRHFDPSLETSTIAQSVGTNNAALYPVAWDANVKAEGARALRLDRLAATPSNAIGSCFLTPLASGAAEAVARRVTVTPGEIVSFAAVVRTSVLGRARVDLQWRSAAGGNIGTTNGVYQVVAAGGDFAVVKLENVTVPAGAEWVGVLGVSNLPAGQNSVGGEQTWWDMVIVNSGPVALDWFSGASVLPGYTHRWVGAVNASPSERVDTMTGLLSPLTTVLTTGRASLIDNAGKATSWPVITFHGPVLNPEVVVRSFTDNTVVWRLGLDLSLDFGQTVVVDTRPWVRTVRRGNGTPLRGAVADRMRLSDCALPTGPLELTYRGADETALSHMEFRWRDAHRML